MKAGGRRKRGFGDGGKTCPMNLKTTAGEPISTSRTRHPDVEPGATAMASHAANLQCRTGGVAYMAGSAPALPLKTPEDCALAYADLLDDVGAGRLTPEEAQTISAIVSKRAELFGTIELAAEIRP